MFEDKTIRKNYKILILPFVLVSPKRKLYIANGVSKYASELGNSFLFMIYARHFSKSFILEKDKEGTFYLEKITNYVTFEASSIKNRIRIKEIKDYVAGRFKPNDVINKIIYKSNNFSKLDSYLLCDFVLKNATFHGNFKKLEKYVETETRDPNP